MVLLIIICGFFVSINDWVIILILLIIIVKEKKIRINLLLLNKYIIVEIIFLLFIYLNYEKFFLLYLILIDVFKVLNCFDIWNVSFFVGVRISV